MRNLVQHARDPRTSPSAYVKEQMGPYPQKWWVLDLFCQLAKNIFVKCPKKKKKLERARDFQIDFPGLSVHTLLWFHRLSGGLIFWLLLELLCMSQSAKAEVLSLCWVYVPGWQNQTGALPNSGPHSQSQLDLQYVSFTHTLIFVSGNFLNDCYSSRCKLTMFHSGGGRGGGGRRSKRIRHHMSNTTFWVILGVAILQKEATV